MKTSHHFCIMTCVLVLMAVNGHLPTCSWLKARMQLCRAVIYHETIFFICGDKWLKIVDYSNLSVDVFLRNNPASWLEERWKDTDSTVEMTAFLEYCFCVFKGWRENYEEIWSKDFVSHRSEERRGRRVSNFEIQSFQRNSTRTERRERDKVEKLQKFLWKLLGHLLCRRFQHNPRTACVLFGCICRTNRIYTGWYFVSFVISRYHVPTMSGLAYVKTGDLLEIGLAKGIVESFSSHQY